jgi:uncharacterized membrane protein
MKKNSFVLVLLFALVYTSFHVDSAEAKGRKGSKRHGGSNSHGKGSHYHGGKK